MKKYRSLISVSTLGVGILLLSLVLQTSRLRSSAGLGRLVFTDLSKGDRKFTVGVFNLDTHKRSLLPIELYQDVGIKSVVDEKHTYIRMCLEMVFPIACSAYVSDIVAPNDVQRFENIKHFWRENYSSPVWSPDDKHIAFSLMINSTFKENPSVFSSDIYVMDADGKHMLDLTPNENDNEFGVTWSADSKQVAFGCEDDQKLCIAKIDSSHLQKLDVPDGIRVQQPKWSPDGSEIVFSLVAKDSRSASLYLMDADGAKMYRLTNAESAFHKEPLWSPDSSKIAFVSDSIIDQEIFVISRDGTDLLDLSQGLNGSEFGAVWSPDSMNVAFFSHQDKVGEFLYISDTNRGQAQKITDNSTYATFGTIAPEVFWIP